MPVNIYLDIKQEKRTRYLKQNKVNGEIPKDEAMANHFLAVADCVMVNAALLITKSIFVMRLTKPKFDRPISYVAAQYCRITSCTLLMCSRARTLIILIC